MASIEEKVEEFYKKICDKLEIRHFAKTEVINDDITDALKKAKSKAGNSGNNFPDIRLLLKNDYGRTIPVLIEAKGSKGKLEKRNKKTGEIEQVTIYDKDGPIKKGTEEPTYKAGDPNYSAIVNYAVNGAYHYGNAILDGKKYNEVIIVGVNGTQTNDEGALIDPECKAYYVSEKNNRVPKLIEKITREDWSLFAEKNIDRLYSILDKLNLTEEEIESLAKRTETTLEEKVKAIHQALYDNEKLKTALSTNEKLYLFCGLIMAALNVKGMAPLQAQDLKGNDNEIINDGNIITNRIDAFLDCKSCPADVKDKIMGLLSQVFKKKVLWKPENGKSLLSSLFEKVRVDILPCLESNLRLDFSGRILNSLNDWLSIDNDKENDVVLTPGPVKTFMAKLSGVNKDSYVWDSAMGTGGFPISSVDLMIRDAENSITDEKELKEKIEDIKNKQILGIEILDNIYILAVLNMILIGAGLSNILNMDSHKYKLSKDFPADVFLLNPPYSSEGKGLIFVEEALAQMNKGYACVLIQESAGSKQGLPYAKRILERNKLVASIKMPRDLFGNKASVNVCIFVFKVGEKHSKDDLVKFIDFSNDGYNRQNRKKSTQEVNLRNVDHAEERYDEVVAVAKNKKRKTNYYTKENGLYVEDSISLEGGDWLFDEHKKIDTVPKEEDFKETVSKYLLWQVSQAMEEKNY